MKRFLWAAAGFTLLLPGLARADVILTDSLSGTGDNVVFDSVTGSLVKGTFNGQHTGFVDFTDLSGNPGFTGAANGNDIKITDTSNMSVQVFNADGTATGTTDQVFSLKGTGDVTAHMFAIAANGTVEADQSFDLGPISPNAQSGFTFKTINGEVMATMVLVDAGGVISDYEHYRIDVAALPTVGAPGPTVASGLPGIAMAIGLGLLYWRRRLQLSLMP
jgi:hypothetical protein